MCACDEPKLTFESMIADPMVQMLMAADRLSLDDVVAAHVRAAGVRPPVFRRPMLRVVLREA